MTSTVASTALVKIPTSSVPLPQRYARALRWAKKVAAELPDLSRLVEMTRIEKALRQG